MSKSYLENDFLVGKGMIISLRRTVEGFLIRYSGESLRDEGGGCFALTMPETLIGIYIGNYKPEGDGAPERAGIIPASHFNTFLQVQSDFFFLFQTSKSSIHVYNMLRVLALGRCWQSDRHPKLSAMWQQSIMDVETERK